MPWVATDNFDSYSNGDLNGANAGSGWSGAWSGSTNFDVQGTTVYQGAKAVQCASGGVEIERTVTTSVTEGTVYVAMRTTSGVGTALLTLRLNEGGTERMRIGVDNNLDIFMYDNAIFDKRIIGTCTPGTWFVIGVNWNTTTNPDQYRVNIDNGSFSPFRTVLGGSFTNITRVRLTQGGGNSFWDNISDTYLPPTSASNSRFFAFM